MENADLHNCTFTVQDAMGRKVPFTMTETGNGDYLLELDPRCILQGALYIISATDGTQSWQEKLLMQ